LAKGRIICKRGVAQIMLERGELSGGCLQGAIRYRTPPPKLTPTLCHCSSCRKVAGTHAVGLFTVDRERTIIEGQITEYPPSVRVVRTFCGGCGSALTYWHADWPSDLSFTIATLDDPSGASRSHVGVTQQVGMLRATVCRNFSMTAPRRNRRAGLLHGRFSTATIYVGRRYSNARAPAITNYS
jgi:hypothetical protein